jgi:hypothetical protein
VPKLPKKFAPLTSIVQMSFHRWTAEMRGSMQCRIETTFSDTIAVGLQKTRPIPTIR